MRFNQIIFILVSTLLIASCGTEETPIKITEPVIDPIKEPVLPKVETPSFNADSAYQYVFNQVDFGPRVPNSQPHSNCADWMKSELIKYGAEIIVQKGKVTTFDNTQLNIQNIIGQFNVDAKSRILLCAHWDTRPFADKDSENQNKPIDGANDGASGVGVLLEIARQISISKPNVGVDIIYFDAEDYGVRETSGVTQYADIDNSWCLGSQYFAKNPPIKNYHPKFGILLDMVGAKDAVFPKELVSMTYAKDVVTEVWKKGQKLGYGKHFINYAVGGMTDDHKYLNEWLKIPTVDIIHYEPKNNSFGSFHHTHADNMDIIDKGTLKAVGQTVLEVVYQGL